MTAWELRERQQILCGILHTDATTIAWSFGLRNLILPGEFVPIAGQPYDSARNTLCRAVIDGPWEWAGFLDSDVIPPRDAFPRLIAHRQPIVSGVYARRSPPHSIPVCLRRKSRNMPPQWVQPHELPAHGLMEVDYVGAGCMVIHRSVLEKLPPLEPGHPWFCWRVDRQGILPPGECLSEDFAMNRHAQKHGYKILVDCSIRCRHVGNAESDVGTFLPCETRVHT